jgi:hypothetical protein
MKLGFLNRLKAKPDEYVETQKARADVLREACSKDPELYDALKGFLFINPQMIEISLGKASYWLTNGNAARSKGNNREAIADYETAARIACYENDKDAMVRALSLVQEICTEPTKREMNQVLLTKPDRALEIAMIHYKAIPKKEIEEKKKPVAPLLTAR